ncbi:hypothetical protein DFJ73DRAFT_773127 [Zopfochytrium polystomum]|nr:hypothetical protein DFJ73DRAFT_773127 [Zopfochytrium polystomum]
MTPATASPTSSSSQLTFRYVLFSAAVLASVATSIAPVLSHTTTDAGHVDFESENDAFNRRDDGTRNNNFKIEESGKPSLTSNTTDASVGKLNLQLY